MGKIILITFILFAYSNSALSQIKIPNIFGGGSSSQLTVTWNCAVPEISGMETLPSYKEIKVVQKGDEIKLRPDIFGKRIISKNFLTKTINKVLKPEEKRYLYDYEDCLENFYKEIDKNTNKELSQKIKHQVSNSEYFSNDKNDKVFVPTLNEGGDESSEAEVKIAYENFCSNDNGEFSRALMGKTFINLVQKQAVVIYDKNRKFDYSLDCIEKIKNTFAASREEFKEGFCESVTEAICNSYIEKTQASLDNFKNSVDGYKNAVLKHEKTYFSFINGRVNATEEDLKRQDEQFSKENLSCETGFRSFYGDISYEFDARLSKNLDELLESGDSQCLSLMMQNYLIGRSNSLSNDPKLEAFCEKTQTPSCIKRKNQFQLVYDNYSRMFSKIYGERGEELFSSQISCKINPENPLKSLLENVNENKTVLDCLPLKIGDTKSGYYTLKRVGDKSYDVLLNLSFSGGSAASKASAMEERVRACASEVSQYLKGPNGEQLNLKVLNSEEVGKLSGVERPKKRNITVEQAGFRSNSGAYEENIGCAVITHELLHLLGLLDEYHETQKASTGNYACRVVPKVPSIMKNHNDAFELGVGKINNCSCNNDMCRNILKSEDKKLVEMYVSADVYNIVDYEFRSDYCKINSREKDMDYTGLSVEEKRTTTLIAESDSSFTARSFYFNDIFPEMSQEQVTCQCPTGDSDCLQKLSRYKKVITAETPETRSYCPAGARFGTPSMGSLPDGKNVDIIGPNDFKISKKPKWDSLLHPTHFERILGGSCEEQGKNYIECSKYAYSSSPDDCAKVPKECYDDSYYLGVKKQ